MISSQLIKILGQQFVKTPHYGHLMFEVRENHKVLETFIRQAFKKIQKDLIEVF